MTRRLFGFGSILGLGSILLILPGNSDAAVQAGEPARADNGTLQLLPGQTSTLLPDGRLLLIGGAGANGPLPSAFIQDSLTQKMTDLHLVASLPEDRSQNVDPSVLIGLRFSEPVRMDSANPGTVTLAGPDGTVAAKVVPAERGALIFVTPRRQLQPARQ